MGSYYKDERYQDMLDLPHHQSKIHAQMSLHDRAAQFAPFAALTGYESEIEEAGRITDAEIEIDESVVEEMNEKLQYMQAHRQERVTIVYFVPDDRKAGGSYRRISGCIHKMKEYEQTIVMEDGTEIGMDRIRSSSER